MSPYKQLLLTCDILDQPGSFDLLLGKAISETENFLELSNSCQARLQGFHPMFHADEQFFWAQESCRHSASVIEDQ